MTQADRVVRFLEQHPDRWFDDDELSDTLGIRPRQQVNQTCNRLANLGRINRGNVDGKMRNSIVQDKAKSTKRSTNLPEVTDLAASRNASSEGLDGRSFEELARKTMSRHYGIPLERGRVAGTPKTFDLVSPDGSVVGDAKYYSMVGGERQPPAKRSVIAEYVWLLEHVRASHRFLVFGNDRRVPEGWLRDYGHLLDRIDFFFIDKDGSLETLRPSAVRG